MKADQINQMSDPNGLRKLMKNAQRLAREDVYDKGVRRCLIDWTLGQPTSGFELLMKRGLPELTGEYLVVKHTDEFSTELVAAEKRQLAPYFPNKDLLSGF